MSKSSRKFFTAVGLSIILTIIFMAVYGFFLAISHIQFHTSYFILGSCSFFCIIYALSCWYVFKVLDKIDELERKEK